MSDESGTHDGESHVRHLLAPWRWDGDDYSSAAPPVTAEVHDGRPAWRVELLPPERKRGRLVLIVDDATGRCLHMSNPSQAWSVEVTELEVGVDIEDTVFGHVRPATG